MNTRYSGDHHIIGHAHEISSQQINVIKDKSKQGPWVSWRVLDLARLNLSHKFKSDLFVYAESWIVLDFIKGDLALTKIRLSYQIT